MIRKLNVTFFAALAIFFLGTANQAQAATPHEIKNIIVKTAISMGVDPCVALSIAKQESNFQNHKKSRSGAVGVFQLMPSTAKRMGLNPYNLHDNIKGGIMYYQMMYKKFGSIDLALAAYNAGPGTVTRYNGMPPFKETKKFVNIIKTNSKMYKSDPIVAKHTQKSIPGVNEVEKEAIKAIQNEKDPIPLPVATITL